MLKLSLLVTALLMAATGLHLIGLPQDDLIVQNYIVWQLRIPRLLAGICVGAILGSTGAAYQTLFRNSLASPSTIGTLAGAMLGVGLFATGIVTSLPPVILSLVGGLGISMLLMGWLTWGKLGGSELILGGIALSLGAGALCTGLQSLLDAQGALMMTRWSLGHLEQIGYEGVIPLAIALAVVLVGLRFDSRRWQVLSLGEDWARSQGVHPRPVQLRTLAFSALGVSISVAICGPITFVGLLAPHLCRFFIPGQLHHLVLASAGAGAAGLTLCDALVRLIPIGQTELPVGAMTGALGAPLLILLLLSRAYRRQN